MKNLLFAVSFILFTSCSKDYYFNKNQENISKELKSIIDKDQGVRKYAALVNIKYNIRDFNFICDSLYTVGVRGNLNNYFDFSKIENKDLQISKFTEKQKNDYNDEIEFGTKFMNYIDESNEKEIYKIIKKNGYPSFYNRKWKDTTKLRVGVTFVLTHFDVNNEKGKRFLKLMIREYKKGRVQFEEMKQFLWHANGRTTGAPNEYIFNIKEWEERVKKL
ncbi:hypothetical protein OX284_000155 [Flavobacterium sp. SUN046]|uniref:hypothetical protein n=1 Tax=Flavobacterium sp. SUN046 TaxID=3002440 RepID=UPI002DBC67C5|nr:hypothetical protein [Flavobacterium sp. SUN046]MEC4047824.1 hypothetical protein [Flavobacterium sp. SUN046]